MENSEWGPVQGTLMTSDPIEAYGGISISAQMLRDLAQHLNERGTPFHVDHNMAQPIRMRKFEAFVEARHDGIEELRFRAEIHKGDRHWLDSRRGVSATIMTPLPRDKDEADADEASMRISADHAWFGDDALIEAEQQLIAQGLTRDLIRVERAYQFGMVPDPQIFIDVVFPFLLSIGSSAVWDGIKKVFGRRKTPRGGDLDVLTTVNISIAHGDRSLNAVVRTNDEIVACRAMESLDRAATSFFENPPITSSEDNRKPVVVWDDESRNWAPPN